MNKEIRGLFHVIDEWETKVKSGEFRVYSIFQVQTEASFLPVHPLRPDHGLLSESLCMLGP